MITHIVNVCHREKLFNTDQYGDVGNGDDGFAFLIPRKVNIDYDVECDDSVLAPQTFYVESEHSANLLARHCSIKFPGAEVYVSEVRYIAQTVPGVPVIKTVSEKGILP